MELPRPVLKKSGASGSGAVAHEQQRHVQFESTARQNKQQQQSERKRQAPKQMKKKKRVKYAPQVAVLHHCEDVIMATERKLEQLVEQGQIRANCYETAAVTMAGFLQLEENLMSLQDDLCETARYGIENVDCPEINVMADSVHRVEEKLSTVEGFNSSMCAASVAFQSQGLLEVTKYLSDLERQLQALQM